MYELVQQLLGNRFFFGGVSSVAISRVIFMTMISRDLTGSSPKMATLVKVERQISQSPSQPKPAVAYVAGGSAFLIL